MADTPKGETVTPGDSQNNGANNGTPPKDNAVDPAEVENLRKEQEKKDLRIRQLENQAAAREKADEDARQKKLEEDNNFKELLEQEKAKTEKLSSDLEERDKKAELRKARNEVLAEYDDNVKDAAQEFGIELTSTSEEAKADFKEKLEKLNTRIANTTKVTPNNPGTPPNAPELTGEQLREVLQDDDKFAAYVSDPKKFPVLSQMTTRKQ